MNFFNKIDLKKPGIILKAPGQDLISFIQKESKLISLQINGLKNNPKNILRKIDEIFYNVNTAFDLYCSANDIHKQEESMEIIDKASTLIANSKEKLYFDKEIYSLVKKAKTKNSKERNLKKQFLVNFKEYGINFSASKRKEMSDLEKKLNTLSMRIDNIIDKDTFKLFKIRKEHVYGIDPNILRSSKKDKYHYYFDRTLCQDIMKTAHDEVARKIAYKKFYEIARSPGIEKKILEINHLYIKLSKIKGYKNLLEYTTHKSLSKSPKNVSKFLNTLEKQVIPLVKENEKKIGINKVNPWDYNYIKNNFLQENFSLEKISNKLKIDKTMELLFLFVKDHFGLKIKLKKKLTNGNTYEVIKGSKVIGNLYVDLWSRSDKAVGCWAACIPSKIPSSYLSCNLNPNLDYISVEDGLMIWHEMGHSLHNILNNSKINEFRGTGVSQEFVEFPSQYFENWFLTPEYFPSKTAKKDLTAIKQYKQLTLPMWLRDQLFYCNLDLIFHSKKHSSFNKITKLENSIYKRLFSENERKNESSLHAFSHIFSEDYAACYYTYLWANYYEKDVFSFLYKNPIKSKLIHKLFKTTGENELKVIKKVLGRGVKKDSIRNWIFEGILGY